MKRFTARVERDLGQIADRATPSSTAWEAIRQRIEEQDTTTEPAMEVIMLSPDRNEPRNRSRTWMLVAASVAAAALVGGLIVAASRDSDTVPADAPVVTVADTTGTDGETAPAPDAEQLDPVPEPSSMTIEHKLDVTQRPIVGTFEVTEGADALGCSGGTFVDAYDPAQDELRRVMTCSGPKTGTFTYTFDLADDYAGPGPADQNGPWSMLDATGDFTGLQGGGDWWGTEPTETVEPTETITGDIEFTS